MRWFGSRSHFQGSRPSVVYRQGSQHTAEARRALARVISATAEGRGTLEIAAPAFRGRSSGAGRGASYRKAWTALAAIRRWQVDGDFSPGARRKHRQIMAWGNKVSVQLSKR